jgi:hypothetical protein
MTVEATAILLGLIVWGVVIIRVVRSRASVEMLAMVLIVAGLLGAQLLALAKVPAPGAWAFAITGALLLLLWTGRDKYVR